MTTALRSPRWLAGLLVAVLFAVACVLLAQWQLDRRVERAERNAAVLENYDSAPVPLDAALAGDAPAGEDEWRPVRLTGSYAPGRTVLVRNRPQGDGNGYLVALPFLAERDATTGEPLERTLLVVRGWVPSGESAQGPDDVPPPPTGEVVLTARLRPAESPATRTAPAGQTYRLDVPALLGQDGRGAVLDGYGVMAEEADGDRAVAPIVPVARPDTDPGPHLAYGVQWYLFALAGLGIWLALAVRHARSEPGGATPAPAQDDPSARWVYRPGG